MQFFKFSTFDEQQERLSKDDIDKLCGGDIDGIPYFEKIEDVSKKYLPSITDKLIILGMQTYKENLEKSIEGYQGALKKVLDFKL